MTPTPNEDELRAAVGPNADYYLAQWRDVIDGFPARREFNPAACLLAGLWLPYRKLYGRTLQFYGLLLAAVALAWALAPLARWLAVLAVFAAAFAAVILCLAVGYFANSWYLAATLRRVARVRDRYIAPES